MSHMSMSSKQSENKIEIKGAKTPFRRTLRNVTTMYVRYILYSISCILYLERERELLSPSLERK